MQTIRLELPYPPTVNRYFAPIPGAKKGIGKSKLARDYETLVEGLVFSRPLFGEIALTIDVHRPRAVGDLDNVLKVLLDSLNRKVWLDDSQIVEIGVFRLEERPRGCVFVEARGVRFATEEEVQTFAARADLKLARRRATIKARRNRHPVYVPPTGLPPLPE